MKLTNKILLFSMSGLMLASLFACKAKKVVTDETPLVKEVPLPTPAPAPVTTPAPVANKPVETVAPPAEKPNFQIDNIQFEFNSSVLKTASLPILEKAISEMKKAPNTKFILNGHSSAEGSAAHNMTLSIDRANAVKTYFVNAGLNAANFRVVGHGDKYPVNNNNTEEGRVKNRRTEIQVVD